MHDAYKSACVYRLHWHSQHQGKLLTAVLAIHQPAGDMGGHKSGSIPQAAKVTPQRPDTPSHAQVTKVQTDWNKTLESGTTHAQGSPRHPCKTCHSLNHFCSDSYPSKHVCARKACSTQGQSGVSWRMNVMRMWHVAAGGRCACNTCNNNTPTAMNQNLSSVMSYKSHKLQKIPGHMCLHHSTNPAKIPHPTQTATEKL